MPAIVTLVHNLPNWFWDVTKPRMEKYAERIGAEFILMRPPNYGGFFDRGPLFKESVCKNGRVAFIDADVVISREAPSIFEAHEPGKVWMVPDAPPGDDGALCRFQDMFLMQAVCGPVRWASGYGNMGVVLCDSMHAHAFDEWLPVPGTHNDQANFNYRVQRLEYARGWMDRKWNRMGITSGVRNSVFEAETIARGAYFAHAAGFNQYDPQRESKEAGENRRAEAIDTFDRILT